MSRIAFNGALMFTGVLQLSYGDYSILDPMPAIIEHIMCAAGCIYILYSLRQDYRAAGNMVVMDKDHPN